MPPISDAPSLPLIQSGGSSGDRSLPLLASTGGGQTFSSVLAQKTRPSLNSGGGGVNATTQSSGVRGSSADLPPARNELAPVSVGARRTSRPTFQEAALGVRAYRQELIAANIANADTPGYKAVDMDFQEALRIARTAAGITPLPLTVSVPTHLAGTTVLPAPTFPLMYHSPSQPSADGNTVEMDVERAKFAENALMYEFSLDRANSSYRRMLELLQNLK